jgi:hypothetical protein
MNKILLFSLSLVAMILLGSSPVGAASEFEAGRIIDDSVFTDTSRMSTGDIQTFLNSKVSSCDTNGTKPASEYGRSDLTHAQYAASRGWSAPPYTCLKDYSENSKSAAQIIYDASQEFAINPQVLIVLLQKEQSLVTDTWPMATQYKTATGYGCPDTAPCDSQYFGLTNQLRWSGRMFRAILNNSPTWYTPYILGDNYIQYNPNSSCGGSNVTIVNRSTQALYNYTPYQPNDKVLNWKFNGGPAVSSAYPDCGAFGNVNFYTYFKSWFGNPIGPAYSASPVGQSAHPTLFPGERTRMSARYINNGSNAWYDDFTAWNAGKPVVKLGTDGPLNRNSAFGSSWRWGPSRASDVFSAVYEADGVTLAQNQHVVQPGQIGEFSFYITAPAGTGQYKEAFRPIVEGRDAMPGDGIWWLITVQQPNYSAQPSGQSYYPRLVQGQSAPAYFKYKNTGNIAWYDDFTAWNAGKPVVKLGTDGPLNRNSAFGSSWRWGPSRASDVFSAVYEADGVTLAQNQHVVQPGQIGEFSFAFKSTIRTSAGYYGEAFRPIVEGVGAMNNVGTWIGVTVVDANYSAKPVGQSYYPTIKQGGNAPAYFSFQNTGNIAWFDDVSAWNAGQLPVKLGTNNALNRNSAFGSSWRWGPSRASDVFSAVYEADGVTLAQNQHVVQPGQIGRFDFTFSAPINQAPGYYPEAFLPIVEGYTVMNVSGGPWLGVTVTK